jgi:putative membrane protein
VSRLSWRQIETIAIMALVVAALIASAVHPYDLFTWWLEVAPVLIGLPLLVATSRRFPLTPLLYRLLALHAVILVIGGHYTYERVPVGYSLRDLLQLERNPYDRIGHFIQGFVPAILAREILLRTSPLRSGRWLFVIVTALCLAFSAIYELIEWRTAVATGDSASAFLGTQGDQWDTQWDMFCALVGALAAQLLLSRAHDAALERLALAPAPEKP